MANYDSKTDYQALINQAVSAGDYGQAAIYEQQRNSKISEMNSAGTNTNTYQMTNLYSGYLNAYRYCLRALQSFTSDKAVSAVANLTARQNGRLSQDMNAIDAFYQKNESVVNTRENVQLLVSWYIQEFYLPQHIDDTDEPKFDPMDESQINLDGYVNKK